MVGLHKGSLATHDDANKIIEMEEPTFLRRLRQQHAGGDGPDRYIAPRNRKTAVDDDEDAPAYVLEGAENETISREEFKAMTSGEGGVGDGKRKETDLEETDLGKSGEEIGGCGETKVASSGKEDIGRMKKENLTDIGVKGKKRKAARIGGGDEIAGEKEETIGDKKGKPKAGKKVKKPVKLSFDED